MLVVDCSVYSAIKPMANQLVEVITLYVLCWWAAVPYSVFDSSLFCYEDIFSLCCLL